MRHTKRGVIDRFPTQKTALLFAYLASHPPHRFRREVLVEHFWAHAPPERGRASLSVACSQLKKLVAPFDPSSSLLEVSYQEIGLNPKQFRADVLEFESTLDSAENTSDPVERYQRYVQAVNWYKGHFLAGYSADWITLRSVSLQGRCIAALEWLAQVESAKGDATRLQEWLGRILDIDPLNTSAIEQLVDLHLRAGRRAMAERLMQEWYTRWRLVVGSEPLKKPRALQTPPHGVGSIPPIQKPFPSLLQSPSVSCLPPMPQATFGREVLLTQLLSCMSQSGTRLITLTGIGGIGKTHLASVLAHRYQAEHTADIVWVSVANLRDPSQLWSALRDRLGLPTASNVEEQVLNYLALCFRLWLVLDNFETHLPDGAEIVRKLLDTLPNIRILVTSRQPLGCPEEFTVVIPPLALSDAIAMFLDCAKGYTLSLDAEPDLHAEAEALCRVLEGIPLAIVLASARLAVMTPAQMLADVEKRWEWLQTSSPSIPQAHRRLQSVFTATLDALSEPAFSLLRRLAWLNGSWSSEEIYSLLGLTMPFPHLLDLLETLLRAGLIQKNPAGTFTMLDSIRDCTKALSTPQEQKQVCQRLADKVLKEARNRKESAYNERLPEWLAFWDSHQDWVWETLLWLCAEGRQRECVEILDAIQRYIALRSIPQHIEACLWALWQDATMEAHLRARIALILIPYLYAHLRFKEAYALAQEANRIAPNPSKEWEWIFAHQAHGALTLSDENNWRACLPTLYRLCPHENPQLHWLLRHLLLYDQPQERREEWHETSLHLARDLKDPLLKVHAYRNLADHFTEVGSYQRALLYCAHALPIAQKLQIGTLTIHLLECQAYCLIQMGDYPKAKTLLDTYLEMANKTGKEFRVWHGWLECVYLRRVGQLNEALEGTLWLLPEAEEIEHRHLIASLLEVALQVCLDQGDLLHAQMFAKQALHVRQQENVSDRLYFIRTFLGHLHGLQGDPNAIHELTTCLEYWRKRGWCPWEANTLTYLATAYAHTGDLENAATALTQALQLNRKMGRAGEIERCKALAQTLGIAL